MMLFFRKYLAGARDDALTASLVPVLALGKPLMFFSGIVNVMTIAVSLYTMQVYDRVLSSQSKDTLFYLTLAVLLAIGLSALMEAVRQRTAAKAASWLSLRLGPVLLYRALEFNGLAGDARLEPLRELGRIKTFLSSPTLFNLIDVMWIPVYIVVVVLLHPLFGVICAVGAGILLFMTWYVENATRQDIGASQQLSVRNQQFAETLLRNSEVIAAMGMGEHAVARWTEDFAREVELGEGTQALNSHIVAITKFVRTAIQVALLGVGALLVLDMQLTGGVLIASSIMSARLLAPIEASMTYWKQFVLVRAGLQRLGQFCRLPQPRAGDMELPAPKGALAVEGLSFVPPGAPAPVLRGVTFAIAPGAMLAIVGPSASGKTTLSRMVVGVNRPSAGHVRLDGVDTFDWKRSDFGQYVGYLPQDVELLPGTVRDNIARFIPGASDADVVTAAKLADCHDLILQLPGGYDCMLTEGGHQLSGGQRQRIGLARALFGMPCLVILDEPNASLDARGDAALIATLGRLKEAKITTIVVSHRNNILQLADVLLVMAEGRVANFGPAQRVMAELTGEAPKVTNGAAPVRARVVGPGNPPRPRPAQGPSPQTSQRVPPYPQQQAPQPHAQSGTLQQPNAADPAMAPAGAPK